MPVLPHVTIKRLNTKGSPDNIRHKAWGLLRKTGGWLSVCLEGSITLLVLSTDCLFSLDQHPTTITDLSWQCGGAQVEANYKVASGVSFWLGKCLAQSLKSCLAKRQCTEGFCPQALPPLLAGCWGSPTKEGDSLWIHREKWLLGSGSLKLGAVGSIACFCALYVWKDRCIN